MRNGNPQNTDSAVRSKRDTIQLNTLGVGFLIVFQGTVINSNIFVSTDMVVHDILDETFGLEDLADIESNGKFSKKKSYYRVPGV